MSLQSSMAVMKAKLAGNIPALQMLAQQGDVEAVTALKEMMDTKQYAKDVQDNSLMQAPDTAPVLDQMVGNLSSPVSGLAAYAAGGRVREFAGGGYSWESDPSVTPLEKWNLTNMARRGQVADRVTQRDVYLAQKDTGEIGFSPKVQEFLSGLGDKAKQMFTQATSNPNYSNEGRNYPAPDAPANPRLKRQEGVGAQTVSGIGSGRNPGAVPPAKIIPRDEVPPATVIPNAKDMSSDDLKAHLAALEPLQKKRDELTQMSRKQLEEAYNAQVKAASPGKFDQVMQFLNAVAARGGSSAAQALGAGGAQLQESKQARAKALADAKAAYAKADILLQQAEVQNQMGDIQGAHKLRQEAEKVRMDAQKAESEAKLREAQGNYQNAGAEYTRDIKPSVEAEKARAATIRAQRPAGSGGAGGAGKPLTAAQRTAAIQREAAALAARDKQDLNIMTPASREQYIRQATATIDAMQKPGSATASPAGPSRTIKFNDITGI